MGEAKLRQINEGRIVKFDMEGPDIFGLTEVPAAKRQLIVNILSDIVMTAFPQGMDRHDGRIWASWIEDLRGTDEMAFEVTLGMVEWLSKYVESESLKLNPTLAQPREALASYLAQLRDVAKEQTA